MHALSCNVVKNSKMPVHSVDFTLDSILCRGIVATSASVPSSMVILGTIQGDVGQIGARMNSNKDPLNGSLTTELSLDRCSNVF